MRFANIFSESNYNGKLKKHVSIDMQYGLINKVSVTLANVTDARGMIHVLQNSGATYADKGYCVAPPRIAIAICRNRQESICTIYECNLF